MTLLAFHFGRVERLIIGLYIQPVTLDLRCYNYNIEMGEKYDQLLDSLEREVELQSFERYILRSEQHKNELVFNIRTTKTRGIPRFNVWRLLLEVIPFNQNWHQKEATLEATRKRWATLKNEARGGAKSIGKQGPLSLPRNPLMKAPVKPEKKQAESDSFLNEEIRKDVSRTYQELPFFQNGSIIKLLTEVLFVWCKINPEISYKQGMNELLASIVWVYFHEAAAATFEPTNETQKQYQTLNSVNHAEADVFVVFQKIMDIQKEMFKENLDSDVKGVKNPNSKINSPILLRISQLEDHKLKTLDIELYRALKLQDVKTKTFLLRWIRCLHSRQFGLVGSLPIWDSILLDAYENPSITRSKRQFEFVDAVCLSMFIYLRSIVLTLETTNEIMQVYQKYPHLEGQYLQELLGVAWSVCGQLHNLENKGGQEESQIKLAAIRQNSDSKTKKVDEKIPDKVAGKVQTLQKKVEQSSHEKSVNKPQQIAADAKTVSAKQQASLRPNENQQILFESAEVKQLIEKLTQSNTYNQNGQSKKLIRSVIEILEKKLGH